MNDCYEPRLICAKENQTEMLSPTPFVLTCRKRKLIRERREKERLYIHIVTIGSRQGHRPRSADLPSETPPQRVVKPEEVSMPSLHRDDRGEERGRCCRVLRSITDIPLEPRNYLALILNRLGLGLGFLALIFPEMFENTAWVKT